MQNAQLPWELKEAMFLQSMKHAEVEDSISHEDAFLVALFHGFGFGTRRDFKKLLDWCIKAASSGSPAAKALVIPFSNLSPEGLSSGLPTSQWLSEAVDGCTGTRDIDSLLWAFSVLKQYDADMYSQARSLYNQKLRVSSIFGIFGVEVVDERLWALPKGLREDIINRVKVRHQAPDDILRVACIEGDKHLAYAAIRELKANVNAIPEHKLGGTPVMLAIRNSHYQLAQELIKDFNADVHSNLTDRAGKDTLLVIIESALEKESPCLELCRLVIQAGEYNTFELLETAFNASVALNHIELVILLIRSIDYTHLSTVNIDNVAGSLVSNHLFEALDLFLSNTHAVGREVVSYTSLLFHLGTPPPLLCFVNHGTAYCQRMVNTLKVLTKWGADINNLSDEHPSCLMTAVLMGHKDLIEVLIEMGADPFLPEPGFGNTSAFFASIGSDYGNPDAFDIILKRYASTFKSRDYTKAITVAAFSRPYGLDFIKALYDAKWIDIPAQCGPASDVLHYVIGHGFNSQSIVEFLLEKGAAVDSNGMSGVTPLFCAIEFNKLGIARQLLKYGASLTYRGPRKMTPLHAAAARPDDNGEIMTLLLEEMGSEVDINIQDDIGFTPLHVAAESANVGAVSALLSCGADTEITDSNGRTPLHIMSITLAKTETMPAVQKRRQTDFGTKIIEMLVSKQGI